jgi:hypothetical protein
MIDDCLIFFKINSFMTKSIVFSSNLPQSELFFTIMGLNLLHLIVENRLADFHCEVNRKPLNYLDALEPQSAKNYPLINCHRLVGAFERSSKTTPCHIILHQSRSASSCRIIRSGISVRLRVTSSI